MIETLIKILLAYGVGAVSGSMVIGSLRKVDIRTMGSGNAGGTNALRTQGLLFALGVVLIDVGKGALATGLVPALPWPAAGAAVNPGNLVLACGLAAVLGHCFPAWYGFRGGKGAATSVGVLLVVNPWLLIPMLSTWVVVLVASGYVGLATVLAGFSLMPAAWWMNGFNPEFWFVTALAVFMAYMHRSNFRNMKAGEEHRFERVRITHWFRKKAG